MRPGYFLFNYFYFLIKNITYGINLSIKKNIKNKNKQIGNLGISLFNFFTANKKKRYIQWKKKIVIYSSTAAKRNMKKTIKNLKFLPN